MWPMYDVRPMVAPTIGAAAATRSSTSPSRRRRMSWRNPSRRMRATAASASSVLPIVAGR